MCVCAHVCVSVCGGGRFKMEEFKQVDVPREIMREERCMRNEDQGAPECVCVCGVCGVC